jgi:hypothetical protein
MLLFINYLKDKNRIRYLHKMFLVFRIRRGASRACRGPSPSGGLPVRPVGPRSSNYFITKESGLQLNITTHSDSHRLFSRPLNNTGTMS